MIKRVLILLAVLLPFIAKSQMGVGEWKLYTTFANSVTKMLETPDKLYYLSENCLFSFDKETEESYCYASINKLNDNIISGIYYNQENKYLLIAYSSGNIDLLYDNGEVVNMSDIKDATMTTSKKINDVDFHNNRIYVATIFGLVVFDDQKHRVIESGIYNKELLAVEIVGDYILISSDGKILASPKDILHNTFDKFTTVTSANAVAMNSISDKKLLIILKSGNAYSLRHSDVNLSADISKIITGFSFVSNGVKYIAENAQGFPYAFSTTTVFNYDGDGNLSSLTLPVDLQNRTIAYWDNSNNLWTGDRNGIAYYDISGENVTVLRDTFKPESVTVTEVVFLSRGNSGKVYLSNNAASKIFGNYDAYKISHINTIKDGVITNVEPVVFTEANKNNPSETGIMCDTYQIVEDPTDPDAYYVGTYWDGIYKIKNNEQIGKYDWTNSTISKIQNWSCHVPALAFDKNNNLWAMQYVSGTPALHMITAKNLAKGETQISDWNGININDFSGDKDGRILICKKSNMIFISDGTWDSRLVAYDTKGTYDDVSDDTYFVWTKFVDQDGKSLDPERICCLVEDESGRVWVGTMSGIFEIARPADATNMSMSVNHIKVPRNDGTNLADYLLDNQTVTSIAVDNSNRKWITTLTSGVFLVSANGDEIIEHFTTENSKIPSNRLYSVMCINDGNSVYIGSDVGLIEYKSNSSPAQSDYSNVYAYPNPVRPDYTGWITITGLMENSLVKIADAMGNVFYSTRSEGGMVTWDGCDSDGQRVKTGVYYVFASQNANDVSSGAVTKILVVN